MQPQNSNTGYGQNYSAGQGLPQVPESSMLASAPSAPLLQPDSSQMPNIAPQPTVQESTLDHWVQEVQQTLDDMAQDPKRRADAISAIKVRYQQEVLGVKARTKDI